MYAAEGVGYTAFPVFNCGQILPLSEVYSRLPRVRGVSVKHERIRLQPALTSALIRMGQNEIWRGRGEVWNEPTEEKSCSDSSGKLCRDEERHITRTDARERVAQSSGNRDG